MKFGLSGQSGACWGLLCWN